MEVDRAHRLGSRLPGDDAGPRVMIARIHYFHLKETILRLAHQQFPLRHKDKPINNFPNYPAEVMRQRQAFDSVKKRMLERGAVSCIWRVYVSSSALRIRRSTLRGMQRSLQKLYRVTEHLEV
ncbi:hypothetical protein ATANTOWER_019371 [Ataeniobius toweri]|uniref:Uncharacterized protein n=1 Tax=Ataeniobius toweri TaxID=208326 RepID=A0ABU7BAH7_9TELE|nr:hypothetical protein [Ataeniobius toweri]